MISEVGFLDEQEIADSSLSISLFSSANIYIPSINFAVELLDGFGVRFPFFSRLIRERSHLANLAISAFVAPRSSNNSFTLSVNKNVTSLILILYLYFSTNFSFFQSVTTKNVIDNFVVTVELHLVIMIKYLHNQCLFNSRRSGR